MKKKAVQKGRFSDKDARLISKFLETHFPDGFVVAESVLTLATPKNSPIHRFFTWDDTEAARKYRLIQAQKLIQCVVVEIEDRDVRKYTSPVVITVGNDAPFRAYCEIEKARETPKIWSQVLHRAMEDAAAYRRRYLNLKELSLIHEAIEKTNKKINREYVDG